MLIRDLVTVNADADFVNDVQLGWYPKDTRNRMLAKGYIFTDKAPEGKKSSIALLQQVRDAFTYTKENRFVVIATYGHGKTHFALSLANFFGMSAESDEVRQMLGNIAHASSESKAQGLRDFKEARAPFLIVRLQGDKPGGLPQKFIAGLETALGEHEATRTVRLPLWFDEAGQFLAGLSPEQREKADAFLKAYDLDTELLLRQVRERAADQYEVCRALSRELYGTALDFGAEVSLDQAVTLVVDDYCGEGKPFAGLLVLFDEFSEFIHRYAGQRGMGGASLQELLNGIANRPGKAAFVAFSQHDPDTVAQNIFRTGGDTQGQDSLSKELTRLPVPQRQTLFSSLETVLAAYLKKNAEGWDTLYEAAVSSLEDATDHTLSLCESLYATNLGWDTETVAEVLTQGCFPLHPLTTALMCNVRLREVTNPRAVLGFVQESLGRLMDQEALQGSRPNWVYAVDLVDYFQEMLAEKEWEQYEAVTGMLGGDISESQSRVLKAMLLVAVGTLKTRAIGYAKVISLLSGLTRDECQATLTELCENGHINEPSSKAYTFWTAGASGNRLDKEIKKHLKDVALNIDTINQEWQGNRLAPIEVNGILWGSPKDYEAREHLLTRGTFTAARLQRMAALYRADAQGSILEGVRGCLIWLVAESEDDVVWFQDNAKTVLDEALPHPYPPPVVLALPSAARPAFVSYVLRFQAFGLLTPEARREYGEEVLRTTGERYKQAIDEEIKHIKGATQFEVPAAYRVSLAQNGHVRTATRALEVTYQAAYNHAPAPFFTQYSSGTQNLRRAITRMSYFLADKRIAACEEVQAGNSVARELMTKYLRSGPPSSWGLVSVGEDLQPPTARKVRLAWDWLDTAFASGKAPCAVHKALLPLFNPPFGYDHHHILLLFSAWYGYHQQYIVMNEGTRRTSLSAMLHNQDKPRDVVMALCRGNVTLTRKDKDETEKELTELIERMSQETYTKAEAQNALASLRSLANEDALADELRKKVQSARERVEKGVERANDYVKQAEGLLQKVDRETDVAPLIAHWEKVGSLPKLTCVSVADSLSVPSLRKHVQRRLSDVVETLCRKYRQLNALENYGLHKNALNSYAQSLNSLGLPDLLERVKAAQEVLDARRAELRQGSELKQADTEIIAVLAAIQTVAPLLQLRQSLQRLTEFQPRAAETAMLIQRKREILERQIAGQEQFASALAARLADLTEGVSVRRLSEEVQRQYDNYAGTPEQEDIQRACERCTILEKALTNIASYRRSVASAKTPAELADLRSKAARAHQYAQSILSERQEALFTSLEADLDRQQAQGEREAQVWLEECRQEAHRASAQMLTTLLRKLDQGHPFLPEQNALEVESLREHIQQRLDENEVEAITQRFQRITDPQKRRACLEALQRLACLEEVA
jgi:hypothetical protein